MGLLRGYAVGIDEVRDIFSADQELAAHLRELAADVLPVQPPPTRGWLSKLGPLFRHDDALVVDPASPNATDVEALLSGRFCPLERRTPSWLIMRRWLNQRAWGSFERPLGQAELNDLEFTLAKAGLPSPYALSGLLAGDAQLPLLPAPGMSVGYAKHHHVIAMMKALSEVVPQLDSADANDVFIFLAKFPEWAEDAVAQSRPLPDLLTVWER